MNWIDVLIFLIYIVWLIIAWKVFWKENGDEIKKEKIIKFYVFTLIVGLLVLFLAMCITLINF